MEHKQYEVTELQQYNGEDSDILVHHDGKKQSNVFAQRFLTSARMNFILLILLMVVLSLLVAILVILLLQDVTNQNCSSNDSHSSALTTGASTPVNCSCDCGDGMSLLARMEYTLNETLSTCDMTCPNGTLVLDTTQEVLEKLYGIVGTLTALEENSITTEGVVNDILLKVEELLHLHNNTCDEPGLESLKSCKDIIKIQPNSPSGYYNIDGHSVYCEMDVLCGVEGGWTRLAYLDMTDSTQSCPDGLQLYQSGNVRACGRQYDGNGDSNCASIKYPSDGTSYSEVCGKAVGYQHASPDAFSTPSSSDIDSYYLDGVSITRGSPRQHIWSLTAGIFESKHYPWNCPCNSPSPGQAPPDFVGDDYFCESAISASSHQVVLYTSDPLWDGKGCGAHETACCNAPGLPWFHKTFNTSTTDYIELRFCGTEQDDVPLSFYEIYVQ